MPPTHYELLAVDPRASTAEIRRAYRALAKKLHPDVNASSDSTKRFARIAAAYEVLCDPDKRRAYDRTLAARSASALSRPGTAHYSWENVASPKQTQASDLSELDDLYDTFFTKRPAPKSSPRKASKGQSKPGANKRKS